MNHRLRMIRACSPSLAQGRLHLTYRDIGTTYVGVLGDENRCPEHDEALPLRHVDSTGSCLDNLWSERFLASLSLWDLFTLWRSWRKAAKR